MPDTDLRAVGGGAGWAGEGHTIALQHCAYTMVASHRQDQTCACPATGGQTSYRAGLVRARVSDASFSMNEGKEA
jgi:hypothetical protein